MAPPAASTKINARQTIQITLPAGGSQSAGGGCGEGFARWLALRHACRWLPSPRSARPSHEEGDL